MTTHARRLAWILVMLALTAAGQVRADECEIRLEHVGTTVQGSKIYTHWRLGHTPWRWAMVSFDYRVIYVDETAKERTIDGSFDKLINGRDEDYTELKNARHHPASVKLTSYSDLSCRR